MNDSSDSDSQDSAPPVTENPEPSDPVDASSEVGPILESLLRYHRKNPLRVAWATSVLIADQDGQLIDLAYQILLANELVDPVFHTVDRAGQTRQCYRITKKGLEGADVRK